MARAGGEFVLIAAMEVSAPPKTARMTALLFANVGLNLLMSQYKTADAMSVAIKTSRTWKTGGISG
jgi:hypothetical protein